MRTFWTLDEIGRLREAYASESGFDRTHLSAAFGRSAAAIACKANDLGIGRRRGKVIWTDLRKLNHSRAQQIIAARPEIASRRVANVKAAFAKNGHPRGMLGKHHGLEARLSISRGNRGRIRPEDETLRAVQTRLERYGSICPKVKRGSWKARWFDCGGKHFFVRSSWEAIYAVHLESFKVAGLIAEWHFESRWFLLTLANGKKTHYIPDFIVALLDGTFQAHEVKGWMDARSYKKLAAFRKQVPAIRLVVRRKVWFQNHALTKPPF